MQRLVRDSPRVRGEGWAFIWPTRARPALLKLAFKGARAHFRVLAAQVWLKLPVDRFAACRGTGRAVYQCDGKVTTFGTARGREERGQLPEEPSADELNKRTRGAGTVARRFLEVPAT